jgi:hypothetical protein
MACVRWSAALLAALVLCGSAGARVSTPSAAARAPQQIHGFLLRADEPIVHTFSRTPSFAWSPVRGAGSYEIELATSQSFSDNSIVWSAAKLKTPAVAVPISLPWITGQPYSLYAHVRAWRNGSPGSWSTPFGFNMRWTAVPVPLGPSYPGLLRWTAVPGASAYSVWIQDPADPTLSKIFWTRSNMADEREFYTFHQDPSWTGTVVWRVRAERQLVGTTENGLPAVSYGPWSNVYASTNPSFATGPLTPLATVSSVVSNAGHARAHEVMPAFIFSGDTSIYGSAHQLYRVEVFTDQDCLNPVYYGAVVGSPAYVPREVGPLAMPTTVDEETDAQTKFLGFGAEPGGFTYDGAPIRTNEMDQTSAGAKIDLWDSDWPGGRYYWTVMPVDTVADQQVKTTLAAAAAAGATTITVADASGMGAGDHILVGSAPGSEAAVVSLVAGNAITLVAGLHIAHGIGEDVVRPSGGIKYDDAELAQDACEQAGLRLAFGKTNDPAVTGQAATPYVSGLSPTGTLVAAKTKSPKFYGTPLVAWQPTLATDHYEVQWSHTRYPWRTAGDGLTYSTAALLPLRPGTWYYRVRGIDALMAGTKPGLSWSDPVRLVVTKPRFKIVH